jgi:hypothetical protein
MDVRAQGAHHSGDHRLFLIVSVRDNSGVPIGDLTAKDFKVWEMGSGFGSMGFEVFQDLDNTIPDLAGVYRLVNHNWAPAVDGTFAFYVVAQKGSDKGSDLCFVVKVRS